MNYKSSTISPSAHRSDGCQRANDAAEMLLDHGLCTVIDFENMRYNRGDGSKESTIDWILTTSEISSGLTAALLAPLEKRS